jgi:hypothetical protein
MLRLNSVSRQRGLEWPVYNEMFKHSLAKRGLAKRRHRESRLRLPVELESWARERTAEHIAAIEASGAEVVGDLDDLQPVFHPADVAIADVSHAAMLDAALDGMVALAKDRSEELSRLRGRIASLREKNRSHTDLVAELRGRIDAASTRPVRFVLVAMSERWSWLMTARMAYSRLARLLRARQ